jgi:hypothetical protein
MSKAMDIALKSAEHHFEKELTSKFSQRMKASSKDIGTPDSMRHTILSYVTGEQYERAVSELKRYGDAKADFPQFKIRADRYAAYAIDLMNAIKAKRSFPGVQNLSMSKQQELFDRAMEHFEDLKVTLKKIEQIDRDVKVEDVRSTVMVVKAAVYCFFAIAVLGFVLEVSKGILPSTWYVLDTFFSDLTNWIFSKAGF